MRLHAMELMIVLLKTVNNTSKYYPLHQFSSGGELSKLL